MDVWLKKITSETLQKMYLWMLYFKVWSSFEYVKSLFTAALYWKMTLLNVVIVHLAQWSLSSQNKWFSRNPPDCKIFAYQRRVPTMHNFFLTKWHRSSITQVNPPHDFCFLILPQSHSLFHGFFSDAAFEKCDLVQVAKWHSSDHMGQILVQ